MDFAVDDDDGRETAGAEAVHDFDGEEQVVGGALFIGEIELLVDGLEQSHGLLHVAGGAVAEAEDVFSLRIQGEVGVEGRHAVHVGDGHVEGRGHIADDVLREVLVDFLYLLKDRNEPGGVVPVLFEDLVDCGEVVDHRARLFQGFLHRFLHGVDGWGWVV